MSTISSATTAFSPFVFKPTTVASGSSALLTEMEDAAQDAQGVVTMLDSFNTVGSALSIFA